MTLPRLPEAVLRDASPEGALERQQLTAAAAGGVIPVVYGRRRLGASIFAVSVYEGDLVLGCLWCLGPVDAIESVTLDGAAMPAAVTVTSYTGTTSQGVDPTLAAAIAGYTDTLVGWYGGQAIGCAYSVLRIPVAAGAGFPRVEAIVRGRTVYDPRTNLADFSKIDLTTSNGLHGYISANTYPTYVSPGWRRIPRDDGLGGTIATIRWNSTVADVPQGSAMTMSVDYRHDGATCSFVLSFYYDSLDHNVTPTVTDYGNGIYRATATTTIASSGATCTVRFLMIHSWSTDGTYIDLRNLSLVYGSEDVGYVEGPVTAAPTAYSRNPALCLADWLRNDTYGQGLDLDYTSVGQAAAACEEAVDDIGGSIVESDSWEIIGTTSSTGVSQYTAGAAGAGDICAGGGTVVDPYATYTLVQIPKNVTFHPACGDAGEVWRGTGQTSGFDWTFSFIPGCNDGCGLPYYFDSDGVRWFGVYIQWIYPGWAASFSASETIDWELRTTIRISPTLIPRRALDLVLDQELPVAQWADVLRTYAACFIVHAGDAVYLVPDRPAPVTRALTDADVLAGSLALRRLPARTRPTVTVVEYADTSSTPWSDAEVSAEAAGLSAGWGARREERVALPGIVSRAQAYREAVERLNAYTLCDLEAQWVTFDEGLQDLVGDVVTLTHSIGLTAQAFRITDARARGPGRWEVTAHQYDVDVYSDSIVAPGAGDYTLWPDPSAIDAVADIACASGTSHLLLGVNGSLVSRIYVTWTAPSDPYYDGADVEYRRTTDTGWQRVLVDGAEAYCAPVEDGAVYDVRVRARNSLGVVSGWTAVTHTVIGKTEAPGVPQNFLVGTYADGTRRFTWSPPATVPPDLAGYELRYKLGTGYVWADLAPIHGGVLTLSPYETNELAAGEYTFGLATVDTSGNYSSAVYIEAELPDPRLAGVIYLEEPHVEGWPDTITNGWVDPAGWLLATDSDDWSDLAAITWADWTTWVRTPATLAYETAEIDLGFIATFTPLVTAAGTGTITIQERHSDDDITWSSYATASGSPVSGRYVQIKITASGSAGTVVRLETCQIMLDAEPVLEDIADLDISTLTGSYRIGTGNVRLPITEDFSVIRAVFVTLQNVGAGWTWELIDKTTTYGPQIKIYNGSGTLADATIDAHIRGL